LRPSWPWPLARERRPRTWSRTSSSAGEGHLAGSEPSLPFYLVRLGGFVYFSADDGSSGRALWRSDGTATGTTLVADPYPGPFQGENGVLHLTLSGGRLYFVCEDPASHLPALWASDGTRTGTGLVSAIDPDGYSGAHALTDLDGRLLFVADTSNDGCAVWTSDGTGAGTVPLCDDCARGRYQDYIPCDEGRITTYNGRGYFAGTGAGLGEEPWSTDGTAAGTLPVADIWPGDHSDPWQFVVANRRLFFAATDGAHGRELWAIGPATPARLLRNDDVTGIDPQSPPKASLLPLDPARDAYVDVTPGMVDPEMAVLLDRVRPLVYYALDGAYTLRLTATELGRVRVDF
jgi:ELWxxDGT repeat protein